MYKNNPKDQGHNGYTFSGECTLIDCFNGVVLVGIQFHRHTAQDKQVLQARCRISLGGDKLSITYAEKVHLLPRALSNRGHKLMICKTAPVCMQGGKQATYEDGIHIFLPLTPFSKLCSLVE